MTTIFTRIINGDLPGRFVWRDDRSVAFLSIHPLRPGHTLVVPREEVDHWIDLDDETRDHLMGVSRTIATAMQTAFPSTKVGLMIAGLEVPHVHIHLVPIDTVNDLDFANQDVNASGEDLDRAADKLRRALGDAGAESVP